MLTVFSYTCWLSRCLLWKSVQFISFTQSCLTLWDSVNCIMPGFPVHHQLLELSQTHVHRVGDTIQPSHLLLMLFKWLWCWERLKVGGERATEDEMTGWHHWHNGHKFEQTPGDCEGQGSLACCEWTKTTTTNVILPFLQKGENFGVWSCEIFQIRWHHLPYFFCDITVLTTQVSRMKGSFQTLNNIAATTKAI